VSSDIGIAVGIAVGIGIGVGGLEKEERQQRVVIQIRPILMGVAARGAAETRRTVHPRRNGRRSPVSCTRYVRTLVLYTATTVRRVTDNDMNATRCLMVAVEKAGNKCKI
jgi:hypothetical protein